MYIAVLFTITKIWMQPKCPLVDIRTKKLYIYTVEYYLAIKNEIILCGNMDGYRGYYAR